MVWYRGSEPLVVPARWALLGFGLGGAPVWTYGAGVGFTERIVGRRICVTYEGTVIYPSLFSFFFLGNIMRSNRY